MITAGIDLASQAERTAACVIEWRDGGARVVELRGSVDDDLIASLVRRSDWTGIDVPLGWPDGFIAAVSAHHAAMEWAALWMLGFESRRYKRIAGVAARSALVSAVRATTEGWLRLGDEHWQQCAASDDAFDALVATLLTRAAALRLVDPCPAGLEAVASREGWIMLPVRDSLDFLASAADTMD